MKSILRILAVAAVASGMTARAQDAEDGADVEAEAEKSVAAKDAKQTSPYYALPAVGRIVGKGEVLRPGASEWEKAVEDVHYPLGTAFRTVGAESRMSVLLGGECKVFVAGESSFGTREQGLGEQTRTILLGSGKVKLRLPRNFPEGKLTVDAPGFSVVNPAGDSVYRYNGAGDGDEAVVRCVTGSLAVKGRHFSIPSMRAANEIRIRTSQDLLFTGIYGTSGDCLCILDQGLEKITDVETGESHIEAKTLEWKISPQTVVRIHRAVPSIGKNMSVSVMTFDAAGNLKNRCAFAENRFEINSGELVPVSKAGQSDLVKQAAEATSDTAAAETEAVEAEESDSSDEETKSSGDDDDMEF